MGIGTHNTLHIDEEFKTLIPPLSDEEYKGLEDSIITEGCRDALVVWGDTIVDGHNRYAICTKHNIPFTTNQIEFESKTHARIWIRSNQLSRRNLSEGWKIEIALDNKADLAEVGKVKYEATVGRPKKESLSNIDNDLPKHNTQKILAEGAGVSTGKLAMAEVVKDKAPGIWEQVKAGGKTVGGAYQEIKKEEKEKKRKEEIEAQKKDIEEGKAQLPAGVFEVINIDPPWAYGTEYDSNGRRVASPYPEMSIEELKQFKLPLADNCVLFLWTTHRFIWDAKTLLDTWGFAYRNIIVWDKLDMGTGDLFRMQCEFCLVGIKGKPAFDNNHSYRDIIAEKRREHSRKPDTFYNIVDNLVIGRKIDIFSRSKRQGWKTYGNDTGKY